MIETAEAASDMYDDILPELSIGKFARDTRMRRRLTKAFGTRGSHGTSERR